jgi:hypothetical protein
MVDSLQRWQPINFPCLCIHIVLPIQRWSISLSCITIVKYPRLGNFVKKRGSFWLIVLEVQGQKTTFCDSLLASRVLRWYRASYGNRQGVYVQCVCSVCVCVCVCVCTHLSVFCSLPLLIKLPVIQSWGFYTGDFI